MHGPADRKAAKAAEKREYRRLIGGGGAVLDGVRIRDINALVALLIELDWLKAGRSEDKAAQAEALAGLINDFVAGHRS